MKSPIEALMRPDAIAVIGASAKPGKIGNALVRNLVRSKAKVIPVNPHEESIEGLRCYRTVLEIPGGIDLAIISLPADKVLGEVKNAVDKGVPCIIIVSAGFSEMNAEGRDIEHEMAAYARSKGSRILGPNTLGVFSPVTGTDTLLIPSDRSPRPSRGGLGVISQSGSVQVSLLEKSAARGIGISYSIGLGNRCDITEIDMLSFLAKDEDTSCIALYLESFHDGRALMEIAGNICRSKPVVAIKAGRTAAGTKAASSHTGAIARGTDAVVDGAFEQSGMIRAFDDEELLDFANAVMLMPPADGGRVAYVGSAGGVGVMASDYIESRDRGVGLEMAELSVETQEKLKGALQSFAPVGNPVDLTASSSPMSYENAMRIVASDPGVDIIILSLDMQPPMMSEKVFDAVPSWRALGKPIIGTSTGGLLAEKTIAKLQEIGIPAYPSLSRCAKAAKVLVERGRYAGRCR
ncbi:MAG TPA: CoA-binding protein [Thermoplasmata archaeon]|nr:CoA-binding protein [Thermoplasmata archaeon]